MGGAKVWRVEQTLRPALVPCCILVELFRWRWGSRRGGKGAADEWIVFEKLIFSLETQALGSSMRRC